MSNFIYLKQLATLFGYKCLLYQTIISNRFNVHYVAVVFQVKTSQSICKDIKVPALGFAETVEKAFENGPKRLHSWSKFAK